jgi:hypothetical protein
MIRYPRACGSYQDFLDRGLLLTRKLLNQGFLLVKLKWKVNSGKIENDPEQLAHTSENSPALSLSKTDSGPVESQSSQTGATKSDLESSVSTTDTQQNIEPPYHGIAILTVMDDLVKRKLLSSKWNDSHILKFPSRYIN